MASMQPTAQGVSQPPTCCHVSSEAFLQATTVAWGHLQKAERKAIRATCHSGRLQHDRLLTHLHLTLGDVTQQYDDPSQCPHRLRASLQAVIRRGARLRCLSLCFMDPCDEWNEGQMWAALEACSGCPLTRLELSETVPLTHATVQAIDVWCPQLHSLCVVQTSYAQYYDDEDPDGAGAAYLEACKQLMARCGPRLRNLKLHGVHGWGELCFMAVRHCTALTELDLEVRWMQDQPTTIAEETHGVDGAAENDPMVYRAVAQLTSLQTLRIRTEVDLHVCHEAEEFAPNASCVSHLSALTALTRLHLERTACYEHTGGSDIHSPGGVNLAEFEEVQDSEEEESDSEDEASRCPWCKLRDAHRTSLLSALRAMPQLQHLHCPTLWLRPAEAASLAALTSLTLGGLLAPLSLVREHAFHRSRSSAFFPLAATPDPAPGALPPRLQELTLQNAVSPKVLALLHPPPSFARLTVRTLRFGVWDVDPEEAHQLLPQAVSSVAPAVQLLTAFPCPDNRDTPSKTHKIDEVNNRAICIQAAGCWWRMQPRTGALGGHSEWVRQLQGLDVVYGHLALEHMELSAEDMCCLGQTLPHLRGLSLMDCSFPEAALRAMRDHMHQLRRVGIDVRTTGA